MPARFCTSQLTKIGAPIALCSIVLGLGLRLISVRGDLWLDEIWSIDLVSKATSWTDVFVLHHDNNHYLNSLFLYALGPNRSTTWLYRLPSLVFSIASLPMAYVSGRTRSERESSLAFVALSFLVAFTTTEARGYAILVFFTLASFASFTRRGPPWLTAVTLVGGLLSHLSFIFALGGYLAASAVAIIRGRASMGRVLVTFIPPFTVLAWLWRIDLRFLEIGGDAPSAWFGVVRTTAGLLVFGASNVFAASVALLILGWGLVTLVRRERLEVGVLFGVAILLGPLVVLSLREQTYLAPRYFLVPSLFALVALARARARIEGDRWRWAAFGLVAFSNAAAGWNSLGVHRGSYAAVVHHVCVTDPHAIVTSDHDFRNGLVFDFYARRDPACAGVVYANLTDWNPRVGWMIFHSLERPLPSTVTPQGLGAFVLDHAYRAGELSGWGWALYRRAR